MSRRNDFDGKASVSQPGPPVDQRAVLDVQQPDGGLFYRYVATGFYNRTLYFNTRPLCPDGQGKQHNNQHKQRLFAFHNIPFYSWIMHQRIDGKSICSFNTRRGDLFLLTNKIQTDARIVKKLYICSFINQLMNNKKNG
jgi:hypothetical protein